MSNYIPKPNTGTLWPNFKKTADNQPDMRGEVFIDRLFLQDMCDKTHGDLVKLQIAGWHKTIASKECLSVSISAPFEKSAPKPRTIEQRQEPDEELPF